MAIPVSPGAMEKPRQNPEPGGASPIFSTHSRANTATI